jgi:hypothetical protein
MVGVRVFVGVEVGDIDNEGETLCVTVFVGVTVGVIVLVTVIVGVTDLVGVIVGVIVAVTVGVGVTPSKYISPSIPQSGHSEGFVGVIV